MMRPELSHAAVHLNASWVADLLGVRAMSGDVKTAWGLVLALVAFLVVFSMLQPHSSAPYTEQGVSKAVAASDMHTALN